RAVVHRTDKIIVLSDFTKHKLISIHHVKEKRIHILPGAADTCRFIPADDKKTVRTRLNLSPDKIIFFTVRNLIPRMGLENLIHAIANLRKENKNIHLIIGGTGVLKSSLEKLSSSLGLKDMITFKGFIPDNDLPFYYQAADLFILPTLMLEGFGLVTVESMACGTPVLGTPVGATPEILNRVDQRLIAPGSDSKSISESLIKIIKLIKDNPKEWTAVGRKCAAVSRTEYSWSKHAKNMESILHQTKRT
ncbi:MAG TPA: glycosyltransferase family 4 protein, partial [Alphaproteobacteria bacterium]|nr:glycosyltransferase family 4 protein [Alphaproteobacteria bacterium]